MNYSPHSPDTLDILIVENHPDTLKFLRMYLERAGHRVRAASTVGAGLELLRSAPCDVLLSDIGLPDGTGWDLIEQAHLPASTYAIAMSGFGTPEDESRSLAAGFRHHLLKPFNPKDLNALLAESVREKELDAVSSSRG